MTKQLLANALVGIFDYCISDEFKNRETNISEDSRSKLLDLILEVPNDELGISQSYWLKVLEDIE